MKRRIDQLLVERGLASSREKARALVLAGEVLLEGKPVQKAGKQVLPEACLEIKTREHPYVSRGGVKLEAALRQFNINPEGLLVLDVGASTGGFTDCLLQNGAAEVYAVDVGYGQLDWKLRQDPRVHVLERSNIRHLPFEEVGRLLDMAVIDASFISLKLVLPKVLEFLKPDAQILALVKPQFEAGSNDVGKRGLVSDAEVHERVLLELQEEGRSLGLQVMGRAESPLRGKKSGNLEFFLWYKKSSTTASIQVVQTSSNREPVP